MDVLVSVSVCFQLLLAVLRCGGSRSELSVPLGSRAALGCRFGRGSEALQQGALTVQWSLVDRAGRRTVLYTFEDGRADGTGTECAVDEEQLLHGDASLLLQNVTVDSEGVYTCRVITPLVHTQTTTLHVSARPSVWLPEEVAVTGGEELRVGCEVTGFYPERVEVTWLLENGSHTTRAGLGRLARVCTEPATRNPDGTFSIRSGVTLHSSAVGRHGLRLVCQVDHQALQQPHNQTVSLTVRAPPPPPHSAVTLVTVSSVVSLLLAAALTGASVLLYRRLSRAAPSVSQILRPDVVHADVPAELRCFIQGAPAEALKVRWFKVCVDDDSLPEEDRESVPLSQGVRQQDVSDQASLLSHHHHHTALLTVRLPVAQDLSRYRCLVLWRGSSICRETTIPVTVKPSVLQISSVPQIPRVESLLVLCCRVEDFYPQEVRLEWWRSDGEAVGPVTQLGPFAQHGRLYSLWSRVQLLVAAEDQRTEFTCRVYHLSFPAPGYRDVLYHINTRGTPPQVTFIHSQPRSPALHQERMLHLSIKDFCPQDVSVTWSRDGDDVLSGVFNTPPSLNANGLYSMFSFLRLPPGQAEPGHSFSCRVEHSAQRQPEERHFTLPPPRLHPAPPHTGHPPQPTPPVTP